MDVSVSKETPEQSLFPTFYKFAAFLGRPNIFIAATELGRSWKHIDGLIPSAISGMRYEVAKWLAEQGCKCDGIHNLAIGCRPDIIQWFVMDQGHPWTSNGSRLAAQSGNLAAIKWIIASGLPIETEKICLYAADAHPGVIDRLDRYEKKLAVIKWARRQGFPWDESVSLLAAALPDQFLISLPLSFSHLIFSAVGVFSISSCMTSSLNV
jgi:hypothetical protein